MNYSFTESRLRDEGEEEDEVLFAFCRAAAAEAAARGNNFNMKKIIFLVLIILLISAGGFFWWQGNQKDVKELNKNLPEGLRVVKSFLGEYKVVNKIDGYEFKVPKEWGGIAEIEFIPEREVKGFRSSNITIEGLKGEARLLGVSYFEEKDSFNLRNWGQKFFENFGFVGNFTLETIKSFEVIKAQENIHLGGMYIYFLKKDFRIFVFTGGSEDFIRKVIIDGKW